MRVLLVSPLPPPTGGIAQWTASILDYTSTRRSLGVELRIVDTAPKRQALQGSTLTRVRQGIPRLLVEVFSLVSELRDHRPDVIHVNTSGHLAFVRDLIMLSIGRWLQIPTVLHLRFGRLPSVRDLNGWEWRWARRVVGAASAVIVLDQATENLLKSEFPAAVVVRIPNPLPLDRFFDPSAVERRRVFLFVGWVIRAKGIEELLAAWREAGLSGWRLEIVGPPDPAFLIQAVGTGLPSGVSILGPMSNTEVQERMRTSEVFVFPSHSEGFPNAVAEAMAAGMAVVATEVGAIPDMLRDGAGVLTRPQDPDDLLRAMQGIAASASLRAQLGRLARERAGDKYSMPQVFASYVTLWASLNRS